MFHNFYIFNRKGKCLFYKEWDRPVNKMADDPEEEKKLVFGMLFSLKDLTSKLSPDGQGLDHLHTVKTNAFTLHHYQSPSGLMFVLNTHPDVAGELCYSFAFHCEPPLIKIPFVSIIHRLPQ